MSSPTYYMLFPRGKFRNTQAGETRAFYIAYIIIIGEIREHRS